MPTWTWQAERPPSLSFVFAIYDSAVQISASKFAEARVVGDLGGRLLGLLDHEAGRDSDAMLEVVVALHAAQRCVRSTD